ncbi:MAG TPA: hypothetical protein PLP34_08190 [Chitinophagaceae bacterium]|nr:hypothetical protein [Chitinophagaceae bacterium]
MNIHHNNYESFLIDYLHGELAPHLVSEMETFIQLHPEIQEEVEAWKATLLEPETDISFPDKSSLYKNEKTGLVLLPLRKILSYAAMLTGFIAFIYILKPSSPEPGSTVKTVQRTNPPDSTPAMTSKTPEPAVPSTFKAVIPSSVKRQKQLPASEKLAETQPDLHPSEPIHPIPDSAHVQIAHSIPALIHPKEEISASTALSENEATLQTPSAVSESEPALLVLNQEKHPRLLKILDRILHTRQQLREGKQQLQETEITVMLGSYKLLSIHQL